MTGYVQFEQAGIPREFRLDDAREMMGRLAVFYTDDGYTKDDWNALCADMWEQAQDGAA